ncbi:uroporphyrinogen decarboxylase [Balneicella halophila]|uniref:Uroporphyrinogen decarboxylase n=1 Tax=Balneicella halophila TaxID=1537566 RepID=A0A7L4UMU7_BALHA|nr:uroporphyrinogen decarboxylase [Balneicella halophila]PVX49946.1 uroporphyrinogen decarboxylase [Balneicella halophila]
MANIFTETLQGKVTDRPPVWFKRQAGRILPSYMKLRDQYGFKHMMDTPELAAEVTLLPIYDLGVDAAILFSDILVVPEALGMNLTFDPKPSFHPALKDVENPMDLLERQPEKLEHIYEAIKIIKKDKPDNVDLIGFCGAPLTTLCYMYQGFSKKQNFPALVPALYQNKKELKNVIEEITEMAIHYAKEQVRAGIQAFELFDTHAGIIPLELYKELFLPAVKRITNAVRSTNTAVIYFPMGIGTGLSLMNYDVADCISIDWQTSLFDVRKFVGEEVVLQGNIDPRLLLTDKKTIEKEFQPYLKFGRKEKKWIINLGHGMIPEIPAENAKFLVDLIKKSDWQR